LMEFIGGGVRGGNEQRGDSPTPAPTSAASANRAVQQKEKREILTEMCTLSDEIVDDFELRRP